MIKLCSKDYLERLSDFCKNNPIGTKLECNYLSYENCFDFCLTRVQVDDNDNITAVISDFEMNRTVFLGENYDKDELLLMNGFFPYKTLLMNKNDFEKLGLGYSKSGDILQCKTKMPIYEVSEAPEDYKEIFNLLVENKGESINIGDYYHFVSDVVHKTNKKLIRTRIIKDSGAIISVAMTNCENVNSAVISGVVTKKEYRNKGFAGKCVLSLCSELQSENKDIFLFTSQEERTHYYENLGFEKTGEWGLIEVQYE